MTTERLPDNLAVLYDAFGKDRIDAILPGETYDIDGVEFVCAYSPGSTKDRFYIVKTPALFQDYRGLCERFVGGRIFELGIAEGGSTALMALLAWPGKLIAIDLEPQPLVALSEFLDERGLTSAVRPYWGVDQTDRARLNEILAAELGDEPLDLVIDDASHFLDETRASFDALFPHLRSGGLYLIEDWNSARAVPRRARRRAERHVFTEPRRVRATLPCVARHVGRQRDCLAPAVEPTGHRTHPRPRSARGAIAEVTVGEWWLGIRRGPEELDAATFRLADSFTDYFGNIPRRT